jgi:hypothetical protein
MDYLDTALDKLTRSIKEENCKQKWKFKRQVGKGRRKHSVNETANYKNLSFSKISGKFVFDLTFLGNNKHRKKILIL